MPAKGFTSITVHKDKYETIKRLADSQGQTVTHLVEYLIAQYSHPDRRALIDETASNGFTRVEWKWPGPYEDIVSDPSIKNYKSTAWIRSKDYISKAGPPLWKIDKRIREDEKFSVERMFIVSQNAWGSNEVWEWLGNWLIYCFLRVEKFKIFLAKEKDAMGRKIPERYYDMGIYGDPPRIVGYLSLDSKSAPLSYTWVSPLDVKEIKNACRYFKELKSCARIVKNFEDFERLRKQAYDK